MGVTVKKCHMEKCGKVGMTAGTVHVSAATVKPTTNWLIGHCQATCSRAVLL